MRIAVKRDKFSDEVAKRLKREPSGSRILLANSKSSNFNGFQLG